MPPVDVREGVAVWLVCLLFHGPLSRRVNALRSRLAGDLLGNPEARIALALNTGTLYIEDGKAKVSVPSTWPKQSDYRDHSWTTPLVSVPGFPEIRVQEGLFWVLEQEGWIYPYTAVWEADLPVNSPDAQNSAG